MEAPSPGRRGMLYWFPMGSTYLTTCLRIADQIARDLEPLPGSAVHLSHDMFFPTREAVEEMKAAMARGWPEAFVANEDRHDWSSKPYGLVVMEPTGLTGDELRERFTRAASMAQGCGGDHDRVQVCFTSADGPREVDPAIIAALHEDDDDE